MIREIIPVSSLEDALDAIHDGTCLIAGGTEVNRLGSPRENDAVIPIDRLLPREIIREGRRLTIGAGCTLQDLCDSTEAPEVIRSAARRAASRTLRTMATVGGNIASRRDDSYLNAVLTSYGAILTVLKTEGARRVEIEEYLLHPQGIILEATVSDVTMPAAFRRISRSSQGPCALVCAVGYDPAAQRWRAAASATSLGTQRLFWVEALLQEPQIPEAEAITRAAGGEWSPAPDVAGSREYKQYLLGVCIRECAEEIRRTGS